MELRRCLSLVLLATVMMTVRVQGIRINLNPNPIVDGKTSSFTIRCDTDAPSTDTVYAIRITKPPSTTYLAIVDSTGARVHTSIQQKATATGSVTPAAGSNLVLTYTDAISCSDAGDYQCQYSSLDVPGSNINMTLQAISDPINIEMIVRPTMVTFNRNDTVELVCSGFIGKPVQGSWIWETRDEAFGSSWTNLRSGLIPVDETPVSSGTCQTTGRSTLIFRVQMEDDNRMYRCYFRDNQHSGNFTFNVIDPNAGNTGENTGGGEVAQSSAGMIVGIVLGVLAFIAIVVVLVFFFVFRKKRSKGNDYDTGEGKNGPAANTEAELHGNPVYTLPSTHPKYGLDNEGLGESTTDDYPEEVVIDPRKKKEIEEEEKKKQKTRNVLSGLQSNQLFQRRSMKNKDKDKDDRYGVDNQAMDGNSHDQDPNDRHGRSRRDPYANEGRRPRDRHDRDHDRDPDRYPPQDAYPESRAYDQSFEDDDGTDNRGYVPPEAIGSAV